MYTFSFKIEKKWIPNEKKYEYGILSAHYNPEIMEAIFLPLGAGFVFENEKDAKDIVFLLSGLLTKKGKNVCCERT